MKKFFIALGIAFALIVGGFAINSWWVSMKEANAQAYAEHLVEQAKVENEIDAAYRDAVHSLVEMSYEYEAAGLYD